MAREISESTGPYTIQYFINKAKVLYGPNIKPTGSRKFIDCIETSTIDNVKYQVFYFNLEDGTTKSIWEPVD